MKVVTREVYRSVEKTRLLIVDDLPKVCEELKTLLELYEDIEVVGMAPTGFEGVLLAELLQPDIVITDLEMPDQDGIVTTEQIKGRGLAGAVIILTIHAADEFRQRAALVGADAYIEKGQGFDTLLHAIREAQDKLS